MRSAGAEGAAGLRGGGPLGRGTGGRPSPPPAAACARGAGSARVLAAGFPPLPPTPPRALSRGRLGEAVSRELTACSPGRAPLRSPRRLSQGWRGHGRWPGAALFRRPPAGPRGQEKDGRTGPVPGGACLAHEAWKPGFLTSGSMSCIKHSP